MTAEIAVMNKRAIALAADSTVTIGNGAKFYNTANKLFMLSKYEPVGIMIYNNAEFMGIPWEVIVKEYRSFLSDNFKEHIIDYANDFFDFLVTADFGFSSYENKYYDNTVTQFLSEVRSKVKKLFDDQIDVLQRRLEDEELKNLVTAVVNEYYTIVEGFNDLGSVPAELAETISKKYDIFLNQKIDEIIGISILTDDSLGKLKISCNRLFNKDVFVDGFSGIVIAGFGKKDIFPTLISYYVSGYIAGYIKKKVKDDVKISNDNDFSIIPFAQIDTVETFLNGINYKYLNTLDKEFSKQIIDEIENLDDNIFKEDGKNILKNELMKKWKGVIEGIIGYSNKEYLIPILKAIRVLPIDELASMAESLVNLTSFRRQVAMDELSQTVGGPVDVAVISKGDGFIWIKRKHYFKPELNHHFFNNYYKNDNGRKDD